MYKKLIKKLKKKQLLKLINKKYNLILIEKVDKILKK